MLPGRPLGHELNGFLLDGGAGQIDEGKPELVGQGLGDPELGRESEPDDGFPELFTRRALFAQRARDVVWRQGSSVDEHFAETLLRGRHEPPLFLLKPGIVGVVRGSARGVVGRRAHGRLLGL